MNIKEMSDQELKALAYDEMAKIQISQNNVNIINQELNIRSQSKNQSPLSIVKEEKTIEEAKNK